MSWFEGKEQAKGNDKPKKEPKQESKKELKKAVEPARIGEEQPEPQELDRGESGVEAGELDSGEAEPEPESEVPEMGAQEAEGDGDQGRRSESHSAKSAARGKQEPGSPQLPEQARGDAQSGHLAGQISGRDAGQDAAGDAGQHAGQDTGQNAGAADPAADPACDPKSAPGGGSEAPLQPGLEDNLKRFEASFAKCSDIVFRRFVIMPSGTKAAAIYLDGMCDTQQVEEAVLRPLMEGANQGADRFVNEAGNEAGNKAAHAESDAAQLEGRLVSALQVSRETQFGVVIGQILKGETAVLADGSPEVLLVNLVKMEQRSISEPTSEKVVRGPRDGFTESLRTNTSLIRRRIVTPRLKTEALTVGTFTHTDIALMYMDGIVQESMVEEVKGRIKDIDVDGILYSQNIEEYLEDKVYSPFPQVQNTERPDVAASSLLEGKVVVVVNNSPIVLVVPMTYWSGLQAADDYTERSMYGTAVRWVRYIFIHISLLLPSLYVALTTFHPEVIPTPLLISIASAREGVPFPAVIEALLMELIFEGLREAGIRLPQQVGPAVSIAGALVIGQAVVEAGIVSSSMVIIVSLTGIASFAFPMYNMGTSFRMLRFPLLFISGFIGFYGIMLFMILLTVHLATLKPFGIPYLAPASPLEASNLKDILIRAPKWKMNKRMGLLSGRNRRRSPLG
ncbi:spore germination protein [Paenibacillus pinistramenti]|uniref:spore germination protein n=1 Tax=Paenibacillus pinistramenti TaxID=1768003 RepID=UPI001109231B|nr:spore germination protein [Paenibacillus pinistramenti]